MLSLTLAHPPDHNTRIPTEKGVTPARPLKRPTRAFHTAPLGPRILFRPVAIAIDITGTASGDTVVIETCGTRRTAIAAIS